METTTIPLLLRIKDSKLRAQRSIAMRGIMDITRFIRSRSMISNFSSRNLATCRSEEGIQCTTHLKDPRQRREMELFDEGERILK
jgi:hypothetical protein